MAPCMSPCIPQQNLIDIRNNITIILWYHHDLDFLLHLINEGLSSLQRCLEHKNLEAIHFTVISTIN